MALVRISNDLRHSVRHSVDQIYQPKVNAAHNSHNPKWGSMVYDLLVAPYKPILGAVPSAFLNTTERIMLLGIAGVVNFPTPLSYAISGPWPNRDREKLFPLLAQQDYRGIILKDDPSLGSMRQEMIDFGDRIAKADNEKQVIVSTLNQLLDAHTTLASALQAWPALWELLPEDAKNRHAASSDKHKKMMAPTPDLSHLDDLAADFARKRLLAIGDKK